MHNFSPPPDWVLLAKTIWLLAGGETAEAQVALAWVVRNRAEFAAWHYSTHGSDHSSYGDGSFQAACRSVLDDDGNDIFANVLERAPLTDQAFSRALTNVWLVCNGDIPDPTAGAVCFHRHDQTPRWSKQRQPSALMGKRIYYQGKENPVF